MDRNVIGGHTAGFNNNTFAVSAIGNFQTFNPSTADANAMVDSISRLMAWKLIKYNRDPLGTTTLVSDFGGGTSRYAPGQVAKTTVIAGHGEIGNTACPGKYLRQYLPKIRSLSRQYMGAAVLAPFASPSSLPWSSPKTTSLTATLTVPMATWSVQITSVCQDAPIRTITGAGAPAGTFRVPWDLRDDAGAPVAPGTYTMTLSGTSDTGALVYPGTAAVTVTPTADSPLGPCDTVQRLAPLGTPAARASGSVRVAATAAPGARTVVVASSESAAALDALLAAPFAKAQQAALLLAPKTGLTADAVADLQRRGATAAYVVSTGTAVPSSVDTRLRALGIAVTRVTATDRTALAAKLALAMAALAPRATVVAARPDGAAATALAAAAGPAAAAGMPILLVPGKGSLPAATRDALVRLGATTTWVVGGTAVIPDSVARQLPGAVRLTGSTTSAVSAAVATAFADRGVPVANVQVMSTASTALASAAVGAAAGRPTLVSTGSTLEAPVVAFVAARPAVDVVTLAGTTSELPDARVKQVLAALAAQGTLPAPAPYVPQPVPGSAVGPLPPLPVPTPPTPTPPTPTTPTTPPAPTTPTTPGAPAGGTGRGGTGLPTSFLVTGSGWGHGVGLSQYGALGMAREGSDATAIVQHYFTGVQVAPVDDSADIRVGLLTKVSSVRARTEAVAAGGGAWELRPEGTVVLPAPTPPPSGSSPAATPAGPVLTGGAASQLTFRPVGGAVQVTSTTGGVDSVLVTATRVALHWSGTRDPGTAGPLAAQANVIGPTESFGGTGHRYRYGDVEVSVAPGSATLNAVGVVRLHDEYLYGIAEVPSSWPAAAQQAQAIAARSYALAKVASGVRSACDCHVDDGGGPYADQTFVGFGSETRPMGANWKAAVDGTAPDATHGLAALSGGAPISAFYTSSTGGRTQSSVDVWGGARSWAVSVDDHWSLTVTDNPYRSWTKTLTQASVAGLFGLPDVVAVDVSDRTAGGALRTVRATSADGRVATVSAATLRSRWGLRSTYVSAIAAQGGSPAPAAAVTLRIDSPRDASPISSGGRFRVGGTVSGMAAGTTVALTLDGRAKAVATVGATGTVEYLRVPAQPGAYALRSGTAGAYHYSPPVRLDIKPFGVGTVSAPSAPGATTATFPVQTGNWSRGTPVLLTRDGRAVARERVTGIGVPLSFTLPAVPGAYQVRVDSRQGPVYGEAAGVFTLTAAMVPAA